MQKRARVTAVHRERFELSIENERIYARLKKAKFIAGSKATVYPTVGDIVEIDRNNDGDSWITNVCPRKSVFCRLNSTSGMPDQAIAANFDHVFILTSLNKEFHLSKIERYLTVTYESGAEPIILLTKADQCQDVSVYLDKIKELKQEILTICISSKTGEGLKELEPFLSNGKISVFLGASGVGKSSLVNVLMGKKIMKTGEIREADAQGRHTTTHSQCFILPQEIHCPNGEILVGGGMIIDTPGIRQLMVSDVDKGMKCAFKDIENLISNCKFSDCRHQKEPGCAISEALSNGTLNLKRWENYLQLLKEETYAKERKKIIFERKNNAIQKYKRRDLGV